MRRSLALLALFLISGCTSIKLTRVPTTQELVRILDLHVWWMPLPDGKEWTIDMAAPQPLGTKTAGLVHAGRESMISMRPVSDHTYEFVIGHRRGDSSGTIDVCEDAEAVCSGQWQIKFFDPPRCNADCSAYIAGEVTSDETGAKRQIVLTTFDELTIRPGAGTIVKPFR